MANLFNAAKAREITTQAIANIEREDRRKIDEALTKLIIPEIEKTANKGLFSCVVNVDASINVGKLEKVLAEELGFTVARKSQEFTIRW